MRCADEIAELSLDGPAAERFRQALLDAVEDTLDRETLANRLAQPRVREAQGHLMAVTGPAERLKLAQDADPESVFDSIHQAIVLHHRARTLNSELRAAERALADDATEANFAWIKDVKDYALSQALKGRQYSGYKLVRGKRRGRVHRAVQRHVLGGGREATQQVIHRDPTPELLAAAHATADAEVGGHELPAATAAARRSGQNLPVTPTNCPRRRPTAPTGPRGQNTSVVHTNCPRR